MRSKLLKTFLARKGQLTRLTPSLVSRSLDSLRACVFQNISSPVETEHFPNPHRKPRGNSGRPIAGTADGHRRRRRRWPRHPRLRRRRRRHLCTRWREVLPIADHRVGLPQRRRPNPSEPISGHLVRHSQRQRRTESCIREFLRHPGTFLFPICKCVILPHQKRVGGGAPHATARHPEDDGYHLVFEM